MDTKVTLSFNEEVIAEAKLLAAKHNISLSRLTELLLTKAISSDAYSFEDFPVASWVNQVAEGQAEYHTEKKASKNAKKEFYESRK